MIIGITGPTGSGKTTLLQMIAQQGGLVLDCDKIYHDLLQTDRVLLQNIKDMFPAGFEDGKLDRKKLGAIVFSDESALQKLNAITHSAVKKVVMEALSTKPALAAIDAIGLFEGGLAELCDVTVAVIAPEDVRIARLVAREGISEDYAKKRIGAQKSTADFAALCDFVLENDGTQEQFYANSLAFLSGLGIIKV